VGWIPFPASPKYQKNIPTKLFEYFAYAVPVVSSDLLSVRPFIEPGHTGLLVAPEDPAAHAAAIISLLRDPQHASTLAHNAQTVVQSRFTWDEMAPRLLDLYHTLLS
jgi:glycosyltransferase involved in cell wall biosynthesis